MYKNLRMEEAIPMKAVDTIKTETYYPTLHQYVSGKMIKKVKLFEDPKVVIDNSKYYTTGNMDVYLPVQYYGKPINQEIK